jgi:hypothetical protein
MAIIKIRNAAIDLDAAEIPNISASKITSGTMDAARIGSGTFADARIAASNVSQHATSFDDNKIVNDISTLAIRQASNENKGAYNTNSMYVDVFQDDTGIGTLTTAQRNASEYLESSVQAMATNWTAIDLNASPWNSGPSMGGNSSLDWLDSNTQASWLANVSDTGWIAVGSPSDNKFNRFSLGSGISTALQFGSDKSWEVLTLVRDSANGSINGIISGITSNHATNAYSAFTTSAVAQGASGDHGNPQDKLSSNYFSLGFSGQWNNQTFKYMSGGSATNISGLSNNSSVHNTTASPYPGYYAIRYVYDGSLSGAARLKFDLAYPNNNSSATLGLQNIGGDGSTAGYILPTSGYPGWILGHYNGSSVHGATQMHYKVPTSTTNATGSVISNVITAPSSTNKMGAIITYQDQAGTNTLNTDIVLQLSADNGSNFTTATMTAMPDFASGIKMAKVNDLSVTAGTQLKYKISFANQASGSKEARIRGVSLQY